MRVALLGPEAGALWDAPVFSSTFPAGQNRLAARQGHHARTATILGGGWDLEVLHAVVSSLTGEVDILCLREIFVQEEAEALSVALPGLHVDTLGYTGDQPCTLPVSLTMVHMVIVVLPPPLDGPEELAELIVNGIPGFLGNGQDTSQRVFDCLAPMSGLNALNLEAQMWAPSADDLTGPPAAASPGVAAPVALCVPGAACSCSRRACLSCRSQPQSRAKR